MRQRGYILIYVLGVLLVLSVLALSVSYKQRVGYQLVLNAKEHAQSSFVLRSAAEYTAAQLIKSAALEGLVRARDSSLEGVRLWRGTSLQEVAIGDDIVSVQLTEQTSPPNLNLFDEKELQRLFVALGARDADALNYAQALLKAKPKEGFNADSLAAVPGIPARYLIGAVDTEATDGKAKPSDDAPSAASSGGLIGMVTLTGGSKKIDLNQTPLELVSALTGLSLDKVAKLASLRSKGSVDRELAIDAIGPEIAAFIAAPDGYHAILTLPNRPEWGEVTFKQQGRWKIEAFKQNDDGAPPTSASKSPDSAALTLDKP